MLSSPMVTLVHGIIIGESLSMIVTEIDSFYISCKSFLLRADKKSFICPVFDSFYILKDTKIVWLNSFLDLFTFIKGTKVVLMVLFNKLFVLLIRGFKVIFRCCTFCSRYYACSTLITRLYVELSCLTILSSFNSIFT
jgi:hypothetical protein